jgi:hypothetical protein
VLISGHREQTSEQWEKEAQAWQEVQKRRQAEEERKGIDPFTSSVIRPSRP